MRPVFRKTDGQGDARIDADPGEDVLDVFVDGAQADAKDGGDFRVGLGFANPVGHLVFTPGQAEGVGRRFSRTFNFQMEHQQYPFAADGWHGPDVNFAGRGSQAQGPAG